MTSYRFNKKIGTDNENDVCSHRRKFFLILSGQFLRDTKKSDSCFLPEREGEGILRAVTTTQRK
jgi:hypothetical protein